MTRTKGAKGLPKDLERETERLKQLFTDRGVDFPLVPKPPEPEPPKRKHVKKETVDFALSKEEPDAASGTGFECGACHRPLDQPYAGCPYCGAELNWTE